MIQTILDKVIITEVIVGYMFLIVFAITLDDKTNKTITRVCKVGAITSGLLLFITMIISVWN